VVLMFAHGYTAFRWWSSSSAMGMKDSSMPCMYCS
jgi:hypothetical protein